MKYEVFQRRLKELGLNQKKFAHICKINPKTISTTWKKKNYTPGWVDSWIDNYQKAIMYDDLKETLS